MSNAISVRLEPLKHRDMSGSRSHDLRKKVPGYVDRTRLSLNTHKVGLTPSLALERINFLKQGTKGRRFNPETNVLAWDGIITFGKDAQGVVHGLPPEEQDRRFMETAFAIADEHGAELWGLSVHRDESAVHAHFKMSGCNRQGLQLRIRKPELKKAQDIAAGPWADLGIVRGKARVARIEAGEPASKTIHRTVKQLHDDLPKELAAKEQELAALQAKLDEQQAAMDQQLLEQQALEAEIEAQRVAFEQQAQQQIGLQGEIDAQRRALESLALQAAEQEARVAALKEHHGEMERVVSQKVVEQNEILASLEIKKEQLEKDVVQKFMEQNALAAKIEAQRGTLEQITARISGRNRSGRSNKNALDRKKRERRVGRSLSAGCGVVYRVGQRKSGPVECFFNFNKSVLLLGQQAACCNFDQRVLI